MFSSPLPGKKEKNELLLHFSAAASIDEKIKILLVNTRMIFPRLHLRRDDKISILHAKFSSPTKRGEIKGKRMETRDEGIRVVRQDTKELCDFAYEI